ncbi:MAG TPA: hypothetical protein VD948_02070, partial [Rhodothermales bacterium]|nr:hypothetical protein [Rhodothermales bacterium]
GAYVSALDAKLPTGPLVVLVVCSLAAISMGVGRWRERRGRTVRMSSGPGASSPSLLALRSPSRTP